MSNGIQLRQNEPNSIAMLAAQRRLYSIAGRNDIINLLLSVVFPLLFSVVHSISDWWSWMRFLTYGLTLLMILLSLVLNNSSKKKKKLASSIELEFDTYVFHMPWELKLFGNRKNLDYDIACYSRKLLNDEKDRKSLQDWYTPMVDSMPLEKGILACQRENYHWDTGLRKRYRFAAIVAICLIVSIVFIIGIAKNEPSQSLLLKVIFIVPMLKWLFNLVNELNADIERLKELDRVMSSIDEKSMEELQIIEQRITAHRAAAVKVPNIVYQIFKNNDEDKAHRSIEID